MSVVRLYLSISASATPRSRRCTSVSTRHSALGHWLEGQSGLVVSARVSTSDLTRHTAAPVSTATVKASVVTTSILIRFEVLMAVKMMMFGL
jgi:hypothetical protein